jgi:hypothetical protein
MWIESIMISMEFIEQSMKEVNSAIETSHNISLCQRFSLAQTRLVFIFDESLCFLSRHAFVLSLSLSLYVCVCVCACLFLCCVTSTFYVSYFISLESQQAR